MANNLLRTNSLSGFFRAPTPAGPPRGTLWGWRAALVALGLLALAWAPAALDPFAAFRLASAASLALLALSLALVWGAGGILSLGQTAFFGIGGYGYAVAAANLGPGAAAAALGILAAVAAAAAVGYFVLYGRLGDVYLAVVTLAVTLILYNFFRGASGPEYRIGDALLGGFNGIAAPALPGPSGGELSPEGLLRLALAALVAGYLGCLALLATRFGRIIAAVRENGARAELLGHDARAHRLGIFVAGGALAGLGGVLYGCVEGRVTPEVFDLHNAALPVVWVLVGGRGTLAGPVLAALALFHVVAALGAQHALDNSLLLGALLVAVVLLVPEGLVPRAARLLARVRGPA